MMFVHDVSPFGLSNYSGSELRQIRTHPSAVSVKCSERASMRWQIARSLTPAARAAPSNVNISASSPQTAHQPDCLSPRLLKIKVRSVSTVNFVMRFRFFIAPSVSIASPPAARYNCTRVQGLPTNTFSTESAEASSSPLIHRVAVNGPPRIETFSPRGARYRTSGWKVLEIPLEIHGIFCKRR
jgi:hypothetical protein